MSQQQQREPGMPCPNEGCGFFIKMSITDLLTVDTYKCPGCGVELQLNRSESRESLKALQELHVAMREAEAKKKQSF